MDTNQPDDLDERLERLETKVDTLHSILYHYIKRAHPSLLAEFFSAAETATPTAPTEPDVPDTPVVDTVWTEQRRESFVSPSAARHDEPEFSVPEPDPKPPDTPPTPAPPLPVREEKPSFQIPDYMKKSEFWLNKAGIAMVILSVIFAFKYSIDKGWITPPVRIAFGLVLGGILIGFGVKLYKKARHFSLVLLGGGIATLYICGFAAFQTFELVSFPLAFAFMILVTVLAYGLSLRQNEAVLSIIGVAGGLATPFLLYTGQGNIPGLVLYTCLIIAASCGIYFFKGWRSLLGITVIGGWIVFILAQANGLANDPGVDSGNRWALQWGHVFAWLAFWLLPLMRESLAQRKPDRWAYPPLLFGGHPVAPELGPVIGHHVHLLCVSAPLLALGLSMPLWSWADTTWGTITLIGAGMYAVVAWQLHKNRSDGSLVYTNALVGLLLFTVSVALLLDGNILLIALGTEAFVVSLIARRQGDRVIAGAGHALYAVVAVWLLTRISNGIIGTPPLFNAATLSEFWVIATMLTVAALARHIEQTRIYSIAAALLTAGILVRELSDNRLFLALTVEMALIHVYCRFKKDPFLRYVTHVGMVLLAGLAGARLLFSEVILEHYTGDVIWNQYALVDALFIAVTFMAGWLLRDIRERRFYIAAGFYLIAMLFIREFTADWQVVTIAVNGLVLLYFADRIKEPLLINTAHIYLLCLALWLGYRLIELPVAGSAVLNWQALADFVPIILGAFAAVRIFTGQRDELRAYLIASHILLLLWMLRELAALPNGQGFVTAGWGVYAIVLLIVGLRKNYHYARIAALVTLLVVVGKLFLVDLSRLDALWRILLFLAFGGVFLVLSYYFNRLWKPDAKEAIADNEK